MRLIPESANANARRILVAKSLRSLADGCVSVLLPAYLLRLGLGACEVGILATPATPDRSEHLLATIGDTQVFQTGPAVLLPDGKLFYVGAVVGKLRSSRWERVQPILEPGSAAPYFRPIPAPIRYARRWPARLRRLANSEGKQPVNAAEGRKDD